MAASAQEPVGIPLRIPVEPCVKRGPVVKSQENSEQAVIIIGIVGLAMALLILIVRNTTNDAKPYLVLSLLPLSLTIARPGLLGLADPQGAAGGHRADANRHCIE